MTQSEDTQTVLQVAIYRILKSLARVTLAYGLSVAAVTELLRRAYVDAAEDMLAKEGGKIKSSRVCALTGLYRKEVVRIKELPDLQATVLDDRYNRSARVISGWTRDKQFCTKTGRPSVLPFDGDDSFSELVRKYSGDMTPTAMMQELTRLGSIEVSERNTIKLLQTAYLPQENDTDTLQILGTDTADLISTVHGNIDKPMDQRQFQRKVAYLHIPQRHVEQFREYAARESQKLLVKLDKWLDKRDTENIEHGTPGSRLGLGIYQFSQINTEQTANNNPDKTKSGNSGSASSGEA